MKELAVDIVKFLLKGIKKMSKDEKKLLFCFILLYSVIFILLFAVWQQFRIITTYKKAEIQLSKKLDEIQTEIDITKILLEKQNKNSNIEELAQELEQYFKNKN